MDPCFPEQSPMFQIIESFSAQTQLTSSQQFSNPISSVGVVEETHSPNPLGYSSANAPCNEGIESLEPANTPSRSSGSKKRSWRLTTHYNSPADVPENSLPPSQTHEESEPRINPNMPEQNFTTNADKSFQTCSKPSPFQDIEDKFWKDLTGSVIIGIEYGVITEKMVVKKKTIQTKSDESNQIN